MSLINLADVNRHQPEIYSDYDDRGSVYDEYYFGKYHEHIDDGWKFDFKVPAGGQNTYRILSTKIHEFHYHAGQFLSPFYFLYVLSQTDGSLGLLKLPLEAVYMLREFHVSPAWGDITKYDFVITRREKWFAPTFTVSPYPPVPLELTVDDNFLHRSEPFDSFRLADRFTEATREQAIETFLEISRKLHLPWPWPKAFCDRLDSLGVLDSCLQIWRNVQAARELVK